MPQALCNNGLPTFGYLTFVDEKIVPSHTKWQKVIFKKTEFATWNSQMLITITVLMLKPSTSPVSTFKVGSSMSSNRTVSSNVGSHSRPSGRTYWYSSFRRSCFSYKTVSSPFVPQQRLGTTNPYGRFTRTLIDYHNHHNLRRRSILLFEANGRLWCSIIRLFQDRWFVRIAMDKGN